MLVNTRKIKKSYRTQKTTRDIILLSSLIIGLIIGTVVGSKFINTVQDNDNLYHFVTNTHAGL